jgi:hypothetical protein
LGFGFDAFGDHEQLEGVRHVNDGIDDQCVTGLGCDFLDKRPVDL